MKHTPGPWYGDSFGTITTHPPRSGLRRLLPTPGIIAWVYNNVQANAALIAAAPELLEALERVVEAGSDIQAGINAREHAREIIAKTKS